MAQPLRALLLFMVTVTPSCVPACGTHTCTEICSFNQRLLQKPRGRAFSQWGVGVTALLIVFEGPGQLCSPEPRSPLLSCAHRHCPDSCRTFTKRLMLEKHIQLMHGIKDPDVKELSDEVTNEEEVEIKEDAKVRHLISAPRHLC